MLEGELERFIGYTFSPETQPKLALNFRNKGMENVNNKKSPLYTSAVVISSRFDH